MYRHLLHFIASLIPSAPLRWLLFQRLGTSIGFQTPSTLNSSHSSPLRLFEFPPPTGASCATRLIFPSPAVRLPQIHRPPVAWPEIKSLTEFGAPARVDVSLSHCVLVLARRDAQALRLSTARIPSLTPNSRSPVPFPTELLISPRRHGVPRRRAHGPARQRSNSRPSSVEGEESTEAHCGS